LLPDALPSIVTSTAWETLKIATRETMEREIGRAKNNFLTNIVIFWQYLDLLRQ